ncbi:hypothetical protein SGLAM104S_00380 [Streptomyces glaucescens]
MRAGLLDDDGDHLVFRHDLLRQAVYVDIPPSARKALHREAARGLVAAGHQPVDAVPHILRGALPGDEEAVLLLRRAADDVLPVTPGLAADLMTRALELVPSARPLRLAVGEQAVCCLTGPAGTERPCRRATGCSPAGHRWTPSAGCRPPWAGHCGTWISQGNCAQRRGRPRPGRCRPGHRCEAARPAHWPCPGTTICARRVKPARPRCVPPPPPATGRRTSWPCPHSARSRRTRGRVRSRCNASPR